MKTAKDCINCGMCRNSCGVFKILLDERNSPRGRAILMKKDMIDKAFYYCTLCGRCNLNCPLGIDLLSEFRNNREEVVKRLTTKSNREMIENVRKFGNPIGEVEEGRIPKKLYCC